MIYPEYLVVSGVGHLLVNITGAVPRYSSTDGLRWFQ